MMMKLMQLLLNEQFLKNSLVVDINLYNLIVSVLKRTILNFFSDKNTTEKYFELIFFSILYAVFYKIFLI